MDKAYIHTLTYVCIFTTKQDIIENLYMKWVLEHILRSIILSTSTHWLTILSLIKSDSITNKI